MLVGTPYKIQRPRIWLAYSDIGILGGRFGGVGLSSFLECGFVAQIFQRFGYRLQHLSPTTEALTNCQWQVRRVDRCTRILDEVQGNLPNTGSWSIVEKQKVHEKVHGFHRDLVTVPMNFNCDNYEVGLVVMICHVFLGFPYCLGACATFCSTSFQHGIFGKNRLNWSFSYIWRFLKVGVLL